jgi:RTX calcium-binding nonapeptide repeat (4 copies)
VVKPLKVRTRIAVLAGAIAALALVPASAHAGMSATRNAQNVVVVTGDGGGNRLRVVDGMNTATDQYGVKLIDEDGGTVAGDGHCITDPTETVCGGPDVTTVEVDLGGGNDEVIGGSSSFHRLTSLVADLGDGNDKTSGQWTGLAMTISGGAGKDKLNGDSEDDTLNGGADDDQILGANGADTIHGDDGVDQVDGGGGNDHVHGDAGDDSVVGSDGSDVVDGGPGHDSVDGDGGSATGGNDTINVDDGERDSVACGPGADTVAADQLDVLGSGECESVTRSGSSTGPPPPPPPGSPNNAFSVKSVVATKGILTITLRVPGPGKLRFAATAKAGKHHRKFSVAKRAATVASVGLVRVKLKPLAAARRILRRKDKLRASLVIAYTPTGGTVNRKKRTVTFKAAPRR